MATNNAINANSTTPLPVVDGGTGVTSVTTAPAATSFAGWDANKNLTANNHIESYTTTATAAGTTTLTVGSTYQQFFTGSTTQTVVLPVTSTLVLGQSFLVVNNSSGVVTVQSSGGNTITAMAAGTQSIFTCILTSGTTAASWNSDYSLNTVGVASITGTANQVIASASTGAVTLSTPQSIGTSSAVQFASVTFGGSVLSTYSALQTWTPTLTFSTPGNLSVSYAAQNGYYTRIGNIMIVTFFLQCTPTFTTASGAVSIPGLPFASNSASNNNAIGTVLVSGITTFPTLTTAPVLLLSPNGTSMSLQCNGAAGASTGFAASNFTSATQVTIYGSIHYLM